MKRLMQAQWMAHLRGLYPAARAFLSRWRRLITGAGALITFALIIGQVAQGFATYRAGQAQYTYFAEALAQGSRPFDFVTWHDEQSVVGAEFSPYDGQSVGARISESWRLFSLSLQSGQTAGLRDIFSGPALARAQIAGQTAPKNGVHMITLAMAARPTFFHLDHSLLQVEGDMRIARFRLVDGDLHDYQLTIDQTLTTLQGESTGWHIYAHKRLDAQRLDGPHPGGAINGGFRGLNYYPAASPWRAFWAEFDEAIIADDMTLMADLGAN